MRDERAKTERSANRARRPSCVDAKPRVPRVHGRVQQQHCNMNIELCAICYPIHVYGFCALRPNDIEDTGYGTYNVWNRAILSAQKVSPSGRRRVRPKPARGPNPETADGRRERRLRRLGEPNRTTDVRNSERRRERAKRWSGQSHSVGSSTDHAHGRSRPNQRDGARQQRRG